MVQIAVLKTAKTWSKYTDYSAASTSYSMCIEYGSVKKQDNFGYISIDGYIFHPFIRTQACFTAKVVPHRIPIY